MCKRSPCKVLCKVLVLAVLPGQLCPMGGLGIPAQEWTQLLNHAQLVIQAARQAQQIEIALKNLKHFTTQGLLLDGFQLGGMVDELAQLASVARQGQGLSYAMKNLDVIFRRSYPGYYQIGADYGPQYSKWSRTNLDTIEGILRSVNMHASQMQTDSQTRMIIKNFAQGAVGQNQLLQAGIAEADNETQQLLGLRQIMLDNLTLVSANTGLQMQKEAAGQQIQQNAFAPATIQATN